MAGYNSYEDLLWEQDYGSDDSGAQTPLYDTQTDQGKVNAPTGGTWLSPQSWRNDDGGSSGPFAWDLPASKQAIPSTTTKLGLPSFTSGGGGIPSTAGGMTRLPAVSATARRGPLLMKPTAPNIPKYSGAMPPQYPQFSFNEKLAIPEFAGPTYEAPEYDRKRISQLSQQFANPYLAELRRSIREAIVRSGASGNPILQRYQLESALQGAGEGIGKTMAEAGRYGEQAYGREHAALTDTAKTQYQGDWNKAVMEYEGKKQAAVADWETSLKAALTNYGANTDALKMSYESAETASRASYTARLNAEMARWEAEMKAYLRSAGAIPA